MQKSPIRLGREGMAREKPFKRDNGMVLVGEGTKLTSALISRLENMGISSIVVKGEPVDMEGVGSSTTYAKRIERLDHLFRLHENDEWMQEVKEFIRGYYQARAAAEASAMQETES